MTHLENMEGSPLWLSLKPEQLAKLMIFQWELYGTKLDIQVQAERPVSVEYAPSGPEPDHEYEHEMRQTPHPGHEGAE